MRYPRDTSSRAIGEHAESVVDYKADKNLWSYVKLDRERGIDCFLELVEDGEFRNHRIACQIKGSTNLRVLMNGMYFSYPLDIKTISYALNSSEAFFLLLVDINTDEIYYQCLQEYQPSLLGSKNTSSVSIHVPVRNAFTERQNELAAYAKMVFCNGKLVQ